MCVRLNSDLAIGVNSYLSLCVSPAYRHVTFPGYAQPLALCAIGQEAGWGEGSYAPVMLILDKQKTLMGGGFLRVYIFFFPSHNFMAWNRLEKVTGTS